MREKNPERAVVGVVFGMGVVAVLAVVESVGEAPVAGSGASAVVVVSASSFLPPLSLLDSGVGASAGTSVTTRSPSFFSSLLIMMLLESALNADASLLFMFMVQCFVSSSLTPYQRQQYVDIYLTIKR